MRPPPSADPSGAPDQYDSYGAAGSPPLFSTGAKRPPMTLRAAENMLKDRFDQVREAISWQDAPALVMPFFLFSIVMLPTSVMSELFMGQLALVFAGSLSLGFLLLSRWRAWQLLAFTCAASTALGWGMGQYDRSKYLYRYLVYERSPAHADVLPASSPGGYRDAGYLTFSDDTHVDATMGLGYRSGELWCVAPVTQGSYVTLPAVANYWAVGTNCCRERGFFECGPVDQTQTNPGGLVVLNMGSWVEQDAAMYERAAAAAAETYGLTMPDSPIFVQWGVEPESVLPSMYSDASSFALWAVMLFAFIVPFFVVTFSCLGLSLTTRKSGPGWHPDKVAETAFGFNLQRKEYSNRVRLDLLNDRTYWSGEVIYDYAFHLANNHMFLGCLFAHPAHPFSKLERCCVCSIVIPLVVFPVAALSARFGESGMARSIIVLVAVTAPRNVLKRYLVSITQQDERMELEDGRRPAGDGVQSALQWEIAFCMTCFVFTTVFSVLCIMYVSHHIEGSVTEFIIRNTDGLGFAFILEPLLGLINPYIAHSRVCVGFFGRWREERDDYEEHWAETGTEKVGMSDT